MRSVSHVQILSQLIQPYKHFYDSIYKCKGASWALPILGRDRITSAVQTLPVSTNKLLSKQMLQKLDKQRV